MNRLYPLTIVTPKATLQSAPLVTPWPLEDAYLTSILIQVPDGHAGLTGLRILWSGQQIVPWGNNSYIVSNNEILTIPITSYITASGLTVHTFNTDIYDHSFYLRALITDSLPGAAPPANPAGVYTNAELSSTPTSVTVSPEGGAG